MATINIDGEFAANGAFALYDDSQGRGSYRIVADTTARDAIPSDRRKEGMVVHCVGDGTDYRLGSDLTTWTAVVYGGDTGIFALLAGRAGGQTVNGGTGVAGDFITLQGSPLTGSGYITLPVAGIDAHSGVDAVAPADAYLFAPKGAAGFKLGASQNRAPTDSASLHIGTQDGGALGSGQNGTTFGRKSGDVHVITGVSSGNAATGSIYLTPGTPPGSGARGTIELQADTNITGNLNISAGLAFSGANMDTLIIGDHTVGVGWLFDSTGIGGFGNYAQDFNISGSGAGGSNAGAILLTTDHGSDGDGTTPGTNGGNIILTAGVKGADGGAGAGVDGYIHLVAPADITLTAATITLTGAVVSSGNVNGATPAEMAFLSGVTSGIQGQLNTLTGNVATNTTNIAANTTAIATNTTNIAANTTAIAGKVGLSGTETIAGAKTFSAATTFSNTVAMNGAVTYGASATLKGSETTFGAFSPANGLIIDGDLCFNKPASSTTRIFAFATGANSSTAGTGISAQMGNGWLSDGTAAGTNGGSITFRGGSGGNGSGSFAPGNGGSVTITGGISGSGGTGNANGGTTRLDSGTKQGTGTATLLLGNGNCTLLTLGNVNSVNSIFGATTANQSWTFANGITQSGGAFSFTGNAASGLNTSTGNLVIDSAAVLQLGVASATGVSIGRASATTTITGGLTQATGALSLTGNGASAVTTSSGALTLTSAAAATWSTASGTLALVSGDNTATIKGSPTDSASAVNVVIDGANAIGPSGGKQLSIRNAGSEVLFFKHRNDTNVMLIQSIGSAGMIIQAPDAIWHQSSKANAANNVSFIVNTTNTWSTASTRLQQWMNNGTVQAEIKFDGSLLFSTVAGGLNFKTGTNGRVGTCTLSSGTVTVANTSVTANSYIFLTVSSASGTQGFLSYTKSAGTSFTVTSTSASDNSVLSYLIIETT